MLGGQRAPIFAVRIRRRFLLHLRDRVLDLLNRFAAPSVQCRPIRPLLLRKIRRIVKYQKPRSVGVRRGSRAELLTGWLADASMSRFLITALTVYFELLST